MKPGFIMNVEITEQLKLWMYTHSLNNPRKFKQMLCARKPMAAAFWDKKGMLVVEFMQQGTTII
jgi:hypothetical protein